MSIELLGGRVEEIRIPFDHTLDRAIAAGALDRIPAGGLFVVVNPSNPTGRALVRDELDALFDWARTCGTRLIIDEAYLEFFPDDREPVTATAIDGWHEHAVVIGSFSKTLAVTGYRVGYTCGDLATLDEVLKAQDSAAICAPHPSQRAVLAALRWPGLEAWLADRRREVNERVRTFTNALGAGPSEVAAVSAGAFFAYLSVGGRAASVGARHEAAVGDPSRPRASGDPTHRAERLARETKVLVLPGAPFGRAESDRLRAAVGNAPPDRLAEAARRMRNWSP
jgi:aspartate/methionine/tyrosine aminotransferase